MSEGEDRTPESLMVDIRDRSKRLIYLIPSIYCQTLGSPQADPNHLAHQLSGACSSFVL